MAELTVASTTDTQEDINKVAGAAPAVAVIETEIPVREEAQEPEPQTAPPEPKESHSKLQRKIDRMRREIEELKAAKVASPVEHQDPEAVEYGPSPKPTPDQFASYEEFIEALTDWKAEQRELMRVQQEAQYQQQEHLRQTFDAYNQSAAAFKREHDDFDEVLSADVPIHIGVQMAITEMENGPAVAYFLGTHRDVAAKLMEMSEARAMAEVGRISATLGVDEEERPSSGPDEEEEPVHRASPPPRKAISSAPAPIKPLGGGNTKSSVPMDQLDYAEYRRIRDQQVKAKYRR
jgi:hypothetical protein